MSVVSKSLPIAALLCGAVGVGFVAGEREMISDGKNGSVRLIRGGAQSSIRSSNCNIKGNIAADGERIYHVPGQDYYSRTVINSAAGERYFCSEREAWQAGWRRSKV